MNHERTDSSFRLRMVVAVLLLAALVVAVAIVVPSMAVNKARRCRADVGALSSLLQRTCVRLWRQRANFR